MKNAIIQHFRRLTKKLAIVEKRENLGSQTGYRLHVIVKTRSMVFLLNIQLNKIKKSIKSIKNGLKNVFTTRNGNITAT